LLGARPGLIVIAIRDHDIRHGVGLPSVGPGWFGLNVSLPERTAALADAAPAIARENDGQQ